MKTIEQIAAEILVECGYAKEIDALGAYVVVPDGDDNEWIQETDPFADTLEGRRQADAIEDWLGDEINQEASSSWELAKSRGFQATTRHEHRLAMIKWCLEQLRNEE